MSTIPALDPPHESVAIPHDDASLACTKDRARLSRAALVSFVCALAPFLVMAASLMLRSTMDMSRNDDDDDDGARRAASWVLVAMFTIAPLVALALGASTSKRLGRLPVDERPRGRTHSVAACALAGAWLALMMLAR